MVERRVECTGKLAGAHCQSVRNRHRAVASTTYTYCIALGSNSLIDCMEQFTYQQHIDINDDISIKCLDLRIIICA